MRTRLQMEAASLSWPNANQETPMILKPVAPPMRDAKAAGTLCELLFGGLGGYHAG